MAINTPGTGARRRRAVILGLNGSHAIISAAGSALAALFAVGGGHHNDRHGAGLDFRGTARDRSRAAS